MQRLRVGSANLLWFLYSASMSRKWKRATLDVAGSQHAVLKRIVSCNADSEFGREHHFTKITSVEAYQQRGPTHESGTPIARQYARNGQAQLRHAEWF